MEMSKDELSETGDAEDIPSDFFDDFNKVEFMEGLSVIDEWDESVGASQPKHRTAETVNNVKDLRELIGENNEDKKHRSKKAYLSDSKIRRSIPDDQNFDLDSFIKPGSRRDPNKTNEAIKRDKEVKVQQYLAKTLESSDDLRPPGTELDDYYEEKINKVPPHVQKTSIKEETPPPRSEYLHSPQNSRQKSPHRVSPTDHSSSRKRESPQSRQDQRTRQSSPRRSPRRRSSHRSPRKRSPRRSPRRANFPKPIQPYRSTQNRYSSPVKGGRRIPSPIRRSPIRHHPVRRSPRRRSPPRYSPRRHRSRSPHRRRPSPRRSPLQSRSPSRAQSTRDDSFLYPNTEMPPATPTFTPYQPEQYAPPVHPEYHTGITYPYHQAPAYGGGYADAYNYVVPQNTAIQMPSTLPVPALMPVDNNTVPAAPREHITNKATPYDALAQLVAEGKISQEDYLKLTPNKGSSIATATMDTKARVAVITRCNQAISKLDKLLLPNRLVMYNQTNCAEEKFITPKYCSPLKRQVIMDFNFTKGSVSAAQQTKQLVESIISTLGMDKVVSKYKKKLPKDMKDAVVQTTKSQCEVCQIRESTKCQDVGTSTEPEYFTSTVHTQVVEQDLISSKSIFNPSGSVGEGAAISIAHLTPAQLVSQLAARAKTLKQPQESASNQFGRRPPGNYDYDSRGGQQYHHSYNNYRY